MSFLHARETRMYVAGWDATLTLRGAGLALGSEPAEATTLGSNSRAYRPGIVEASLSLEGYLDAAANASADQLRARLNESVTTLWTLLPAGDAFGGQVQHLSARAGSLETSVGANELVAFSAAATGSGDPLTATVLLEQTTLTATGTGSSLDNGAASSNGATLFCHLFGLSGTSPTVTIAVEESADGVTWTTLATLASGASAPGAFVVSVAGSVKRRLRASATLGATTTGVTLHVSAARG